MVTTGRWDEEVPPPARRPLGEPGTAIPRYGLLLPGACDVRAALLRVLRIDDAEVAWAVARTAADVAEDVDAFTPAQLERAATALVELGGMVTLVGISYQVRLRSYTALYAAVQRNGRAERMESSVSSSPGPRPQ